MSVDNLPTLIHYAELLGGLPFSLLSDFHPKGDVGQRFGVYDKQRGIEKRATVIVDQSGTIRFHRINPIAQARDVEELLKALDDINQSTP